MGDGADDLALLNVDVAATVVIAVLQAANAYLNAYYTVSIDQRVAHDLRQSVYAHLQRLSMFYYDRQQIGPIVSTITDDINSVQDFVSTSLLDIVIDSLTIVGMVAVMMSLNWRFTLVALAVMPLVLVFIYRLRLVIKTVKVRRRSAVFQRQCHPSRGEPAGESVRSGCNRAVSLGRMLTTACTVSRGSCIGSASRASGA